jgi:Zn-dependent M28 family amino/carboxypeptidase
VCLAVCAALPWSCAEETGGGWLPSFAMPGTPYTGPLPALTEAERALATALEADVTALAVGIGERHAGRLHFDALRRAEALLQERLAKAGYEVERQAFVARGRTVANLVVERPGADKAAEIVVVGAHYDSAEGTPGANDNATGTAAALALARAFAARAPARTLRFVFFTNEEMPWFQTDQMGSLVYARRCRERNERIVAMLSLETIGYFDDEPGSQSFASFPPLRLLYPDTGNFLAFIGNVESGPLVRRSVGAFRETTRFPAYGCAIPDVVEGVGWSDHWAFWQEGYPGVMVTDTAVFRYPYYHDPEDTPDKLDFGRIARVVAGLERVVTALVDDE